MTLSSVIIPTCRRNEALTRCLASFAPAKQVGMALFHGSSANPKRDCINAHEVIVTDDGSLSTAEMMLQEGFPWAQWVSGPKRGLAAYAHAAAAGNCTVLEGMTLPQGNREAADMECPINTSGGRLWSCNFAIKRRLFIEIGGFDENFPAPAVEDKDMQARLSRAGYKAVFVPEACVKHPWRPRRGVTFARLQARSFFYYVNKHPESRRWFSLTSLVNRVAGAPLRDFPKHIVSYKGKVALRALTLDLAFVSFLFIHLAKPKIRVPGAAWRSSGWGRQTPKKRHDSGWFW